MPNRSSPFTLSEATAFIDKANELVQEEHVEKYLFFVYSIKGFTKDAILFLKENKIAWSDDEQWLDNTIPNKM